MQRFLFAVLSAAVLSNVLMPVAFAAPPSGDSNPSDRFNTTVDRSQIIGGSKVDLMDKQGMKPPSGDGNPSDLFNNTVDQGQIVNPHPSK